MRGIGKTIVPRVRHSLQKRGLLGTVWRCMLGPYYLLRTYQRIQKNYRRPRVQDQFDLDHGVETSMRVHMTDLEIESPNWIYAGGYWPTPPALITDALSGLDIRFENFVFLDFGSGKGRVLLLASEFPFQKIVGIEFSLELHAIAQENISRYKSGTQKCRDITSVCGDFTQFPLPTKPLFLFLYNPASEQVMHTVAENIYQSLIEQPREIWVLYVTPTYDIFDSGKPLRLRKVKSTDQYSLLTNSPAA